MLYLYLLSIAGLITVLYIISVSIYQLNIMSLSLIFVGIFVGILLLKYKKICHLMEKLEIAFMFLVLIGFAYLGFCLYSVGWLYAP
ncbi:hypothetical protein [Methanotorris igneus]|uniref:Uncharacterized protein n=1 Tax=Methanotorris igneus (strain DSM 5666 / JCM 11834 / Kol 5) TaxID=880724 RepID=F6BBE6_METIK|nr:hypothetical protein [Methanotorris igneus]AEF97153.1 hypothetical protein Metig_1620 [Methanotorris igneus Kol 5]